MADLLTTLHPINDDTTDLYPNVKRDNLPQNVKAELDAIPYKVDKVQGKGLSTNDFTNTDKALVDTIPDKVDKVTGKGLSTNDYTNADKTLVDSIPDKVNKEQGKGLSTNDFTNAYKAELDTAIPEQIQLIKDNIQGLGTAVSGKVDKVSGKGLSTNDYTNTDKALVDTIPDKVDKVQGKGLSTNDYTNADKSYLDNLPNYFISIASGGVVNLANPPSPISTNYFGAKCGTTSNFLLSDNHIQAKVTGNTGETWNFLMYGNANSVPMFTHITPASGAIPSQITQYKLPLDVPPGSHDLALGWIDVTEDITIVEEPGGWDGVIPLSIKISPDRKFIFLCFFCRLQVDSSYFDVIFTNLNTLFNDYAETFGIPLKNGMVDFTKAESVPESGNYDILRVEAHINDEYDNSVVFSTIMPITEYDI